MAKKTKTPRRRASSKNAQGKSPSLWIVLLCLLPVVVLVWFLMQLEAGRDEVRRAETSRQRKPAEHAGQQPAPLKRPAPKYDFYTELSKGSSRLPPETPPAPKKADPPKVPEKSKNTAEIARADSALRGEIPPPRQQYFLQAASFRKVADAERLRAQLALSGQVTQLEQAKVGQQVWHRVMIGPFADADQMDKARNLLAARGFKQLLPQKRSFKNH